MFPYQLWFWLFVIFHYIKSQKCKSVIVLCICDECMTTVSLKITQRQINIYLLTETVQLHHKSNIIIYIPLLASIGWTPLFAWPTARTSQSLHSRLLICKCGTGIFIFAYHISVSFIILYVWNPTRCGIKTCTATIAYTHINCNNILGWTLNT